MISYENNAKSPAFASSANILFPFSRLVSSSRYNSAKKYKKTFNSANLFQKKTIKSLFLHQKTTFKGLFTTKIAPTSAIFFSITL